MPDLTPDDERLQREVLDCLDAAKKGIHDKFVKQAEGRYAQYRSFQDFRDQTNWQPRDVDRGLEQAQAGFGSSLFIPYGYSTVETVNARMLSNAPRMIVLPVAPEAEQNVRNMKVLIERQQSNVDYELVLQDVGKDGHIYGLGVSKDFWRKETRPSKVVVKGRATAENPAGWIEKPIVKTIFDDNIAEAVDPFDFLWDPMGYDMRSVRWVIHRIWRNTGYCIDMLRSGKWENATAIGLTEEDIKGSGAEEKFTDVWRHRRQAEGIGDSDSRENQVHELLEYHDGERVTLLLDRKWPVAHGMNPAWHGEIPFSVFRPSAVNKRMVGIGAIEPIEDLIEEMNTLRQQRRDNATYVLQQPFLFQTGSMDPADFKIGPGVGVEVQGIPGEMVQQWKMGDIPNSGYQEEAALQANIETASGLSDPATGGSQGGPAASTATGVQIVMGATGIRVGITTRRFELEVIKRQARHWLSNNQQHVIEKPLRIDLEGTEEQQDPSQPPAGRWEWITLTPEELAGEMHIEPEGGSTAPDNVPQMRNDAMMLFNLTRGNMDIDQRRILVKVLELAGVNQPELYLAPDQRIPPMFLDVLLRTGKFGQGPEGEQQILQLVQEAQQEQAQQQSGAPGASPVPSQNGQAPSTAQT